MNSTYLIDWNLRYLIQLSRSPFLFIKTEYKILFKKKSDLIRGNYQAYLNVKIVRVPYLKANGTTLE